MSIAEYLLKTTPMMIDSALLIARLFIGICFLTHGLGKLGIVGTGNMSGFVGWLKSMNIPFAEAQARMAMLAEVSGGILIALGLFTRVGLVMCFFTMVVAVVLGHKGAGYLITNTPPGNEYALNLAAICVVLFLLGPGTFSLDAVIFLF